MHRQGYLCDGDNEQLYIYYNNIIFNIIIIIIWLKFVCTPATLRCSLSSCSYKSSQASFDNPVGTLDFVLYLFQIFTTIVTRVLHMLQKYS